MYKGCLSSTQIQYTQWCAPVQFHKKILCVTTSYYTLEHEYNFDVENIRAKHNYANATSSLLFLGNLVD